MVGAVRVVEVVGVAEVVEVFEDQNVPTTTTRRTLPFTRPCRRRLVKMVALSLEEV